MHAFGQKLGLNDLLREIQMATMPMSAHGSSESAMAAAKGYANADRLAQWQWQKFSEILTKNYSRDQLRAMWDAADEENLIRGGHMAAAPDKGLAALSPDQRATMDVLHQYGEELLQRARDAGMFDGEALPYWSPRMVLMVAEDGTYKRSGAPAPSVSTSPLIRPA
jgi:hypothetical protein